MKDYGLKAHDVRSDPFDTGNAPIGISPDKLNEAARWYWRAMSIDGNRPPTRKEQERRQKHVEKHPDDATLLHLAESGMDWPEDKGRPKHRALRQLVRELTALYPKGLPKYTINPYNDTIPRGPLLDYLRYCMETIGIDEIPNEEAMRKIVREVKT